MKRNLLYKAVDRTAKTINCYFPIGIKASKKGKILSFTSKDFQRINDFSVYSCSKGVSYNNKFPAGKYVDVVTNANTLFISFVCRNRPDYKNMTLLATSGVDVYEFDKKWKWIKTIVPDNPWIMKVSDKIEFGNNEQKCIRLYMPLFSSVLKFDVAVKEKATLSIKGKDGIDVLVYGSSISQGCAASRPGLSYTNILSRMGRYNIMNYGFSESCRGENLIIEYIAQKKASVYIIEYDHNSSIEELLKNHRKIYLEIRNNNLNSLIIFMSRISGGISISTEECLARNNIINDTIKFAKEKGDNNVLFINGNELLAQEREIYLTDDRHPNDFGMFEIAKRIDEIIKNKEIINK